MPRPATVPELLDVARRSGLLSPSALARAGFLLAPLPPDALADAVERLGAANLFTTFQLQQLAAGRHKGLTLGGFRVLDRLGAGGMGTVFLASPAGSPAERVAVKVLSRGMAADPLVLERFRREARVAAEIDHPNVIRVLAVEADGDPPYLVMEYADGVTLQAAVARGGTFGAGGAAECGRQAALALGAAHALGIVHRDVKPANLIATRDGRVKLLDLGIARVPDGGDLTRRQEPGTVLGTAEYLAPEQAHDSSAVDTRADLYALGGTLYFLLTGQPPFGTGESAELLERKETSEPHRLENLRPDIPAGLAGVVHGLLARDPARRPATPFAAAALLAPYAKPEADFAARLFNPAGRRPPVPSAASAPAVAGPTAVAPPHPSEGAPTVRLAPGNAPPPAS